MEDLTQYKFYFSIITKRKLRILLTQAEKLIKKHILKNYHKIKNISK